MQLERAQREAKEIVRRLSPYCSKIEVAGSIRRRKSIVRDIDLVLIPSDIWNLHHEIKGMGQVRLSGPKMARVIINFIQVDFYFATPETWATLLLVKTGSKENNIRLATLAKDRGWHLAANGDGLFNGDDQRIAGDTEISIYAMLGERWQRPEERG